MDSISIGQHEDMKKIRVSEWKATVEREIQERLVSATELRTTINEAKTDVKRTYYNKKFKKINDEIYRLVSTLQAITAQEEASLATRADPTSDANITPANEDTQINTDA